MIDALAMSEHLVMLHELLRELLHCCDVVGRMSHRCALSHKMLQLSEILVSDALCRPLTTDTSLTVLLACCCAVKGRV